MLVLLSNMGERCVCSLWVTSGCYILWGGLCVSLPDKRRRGQKTLLSKIQRKPKVSDSKTKLSKKIVDLSVRKFDIDINIGFDNLAFLKVSDSVSKKLLSEKVLNLVLKQMVFDFFGFGLNSDFVRISSYTGRHLCLMLGIVFRVIPTVETTTKMKEMKETA